MTLRELLWGGERRSQVIQKCCNKGQVVWASKYDCKLKKTRYLKLRNLSIFWEDASLDSLKSSLSYASSHQTWGPCPVFFTSWASLGLFVGRGCSLMTVRWQVSLSFLCSLRVHRLTLEGCNCWWLWHPCLLIRQEIFHFSQMFALICLSVFNAFFSHLPVKF